jgi:anthranilate synthase/aminodeoxychorismate synthase-like glutamine amidotransferase
MKKLLLVDCYDSFTHKLSQTLKETGLCSVKIIPWDILSFSELNDYDAVVLSPGPGLPQEYKFIFKLLNELKKKKVLGVCLGHQIIGLACGASLKHLDEVVHGECSKLEIIMDSNIFNSIENGSRVGLYHSWVLHGLPDVLKKVAVSETGNIMLIEHTEYPWTGMQFHPESYMTTDGKQMLRNWLEDKS